MPFKERALEIIRLNDNRSNLLAGGAAIAIAAAVGGLIIGRSTAPAPVEQTAPPAKAEQAGAEAPSNFVPMTAAKIAASGISSEPVGPGSLKAEIIAQGTVTAPPEGQALVTARADGAIVRISKRLGDPVGAGETLVLMESREAANLVGERSAALARERAAHAAAAREQRLFTNKITARQDLEAANSAHSIAESDLRRTQDALRAAGVVGERYLAVRSPIAGRITEVDTQLGAYVSAGAELFNVANPTRIQIEAAVPATDAQRVLPGDKAVIELPGGGIVEGAVRSSTPSVNIQSRAATVVIQLTGAPGGLRQGQAVRVRITPYGTKTNGIIIPETAVQQVGGRDVVFVQTQGGFKAVPVSVGSRGNGRVEILDGLQAGQTVVTEGAFVLKSQLGASEAEE